PPRQAGRGPSRGAARPRSPRQGAGRHRAAVRHRRQAGEVAVGKNRLEAFSDGVIAIIITIMVLELKIPHDAHGLAALRPIVPNLCSYVVSFVFVGIYWNNHHHMLHATRKINGRVLWANQHLLFWLSLIPVVTGWIGESPGDSWPTAAYGFVMFMSAIA